MLLDFELATLSAKKSNLVCNHRNPIDNRPPLHCPDKCCRVLTNVVVLQIIGEMQRGARVSYCSQQGIVLFRQTCVSIKVICLLSICLQRLKREGVSSVLTEQYRFSTIILILIVFHRFLLLLMVMHCNDILYTVSHNKT